MSTTVRITETYDLKTTVNKLGIIGIHTPSKDLIKRLYPGLIKNHKYMKLQRCDITGVCASVLPADPLQVGVAEGDVAPEDMFNPILYKPVSNDGFNVLQNRIYALSDVGDTLVSEWNSNNAFDTYYALLSESKTFKKAMPQNGFALRGLYPICYQMINTYGNNYNIGQVATTSENVGVNVTNDKAVRQTSANLDGTSTGTPAVTFRGKSVKMPRFPLHQLMEDGLNTTYDTVSIDTFVIPKTFVALFLIPPARLHEFYYRMRVSWVITFSGVVSTLEYGHAQVFDDVSQTAYHKNFTYDSAKVQDLESTNDLVDASGVGISKIMES